MNITTEDVILEDARNNDIIMLQNNLQHYTIDGKYLAKVICDEKVKHNIPIVRLLLQHGADIKNNKYLLFNACEKGSIEMVTLLVQYGSIVCTSNKREVVRPWSGEYLTETPLTIACRNGHTNCVKFLLENGADVNYGSPSPLQCACERNDFNLVKILVEHGANSNIRLIDNHTYYMCSYGKDKHPKENFMTPLHYACNKCAPEAVEALLKHGADVNAVYSQQCLTPLHVLLGMHQSEAIQAQCLALLVEHGADIYQSRYDGRTPLYLACISGVSCVRLLLDNCDISQHKLSFRSLNHTNTDSTPRECIAMAIIAGVQVTLDKSSWSIMLHQLFCQYGEETVKQLLPQIDLNIVSCVDIVKSGRYEWLELLLTAGVNPNICTDIEYPLHAAVSSGDLRRVELLITHGANVNNSNPKTGITPLLVAAEREDLLMIELLLSHGADVNIARGILRKRVVCVEQEDDDEEDDYDEDGDGDNGEEDDGDEDDGNEDEDGDHSEIAYHESIDCTPLTKACWKKELTCVKLLLEKGANPNCIIKGRTLLHHLQY